MEVRGGIQFQPYTLFLDNYFCLLLLLFLFVAVVVVVALSDGGERGHAISAIHMLL